MLARDDYYDSAYADYLIRAPAMPLPEVLMKFQKGLSALGLKNPLPEKKGGQKLGAGVFGAAYKLPGKNPGEPATVLKLTKDPEEAMASCILTGKKLRHVVGIQCVWVMKGSKRKKDKLEWFAVHREYLNPTKKTDRELMEIMFEIVEEEDFDDVVIPRSRAAMQRWHSYMKNALDYEEMKEHGPNGLLKRSMEILRQVAEGTKELQQIGLDWQDFHPDNVLRDVSTGLLKIADIGHGEWRIDYNLEMDILHPHGPA